MLTIAIIGRPNVGKSTLFNRLVGKKTALVDNSPGLTRDRREGEAGIGDLNFKVIDTAGLEQADNESLEQLMMKQTEKAVDDSDVVFFVIDGRDGVTPVDQYFARWLRKKKKNTILLVNKCESMKNAPGLAEAYSLGFGDPIAISAEHGLGMGEIYTQLCTINIKDAGDTEESNAQESLTDEILQIAIVGRPNVGKSTLFNRLLGEERSIVSPVSGTTRDAVYVQREFNNRKVRLVDTAGMRKKAKLKEKTEKLAVEDSLKAIKYANVVVLVIDSISPFDKQEMIIADHVLNEGRGLIIAANKWDLVENKHDTYDEMKYRLEKVLSQGHGTPLITISALSGNNVEKIMKAAFEVFDAWNKRISTGQLNKWLEMAASRHVPPLSGGKRIKLRYITQVKTRPPTFSLFSGGRIKDLPESYIRYLANSLRDEFGFGGVPIRVMLRKSDNPFK